MNPDGTPENLKPKAPWKKGQSGNPKGRPKRLQIEDLLEHVQNTNSERAISRVWLAQILQGNYQFFREYLDRRDGKVPTPVEVETKQEIDWSAVDIECDTPALPDE